jgi:hypothetical protein
MATYPAQSVELEAGWESQAFGPSPWLNTADEATSYLEGTAFFVFRADFGDVPATDSFALAVQARINGFAVLRVSLTYGGTGGVTPGTSADVDLYGIGLVDEAWGSAQTGAVPLSHPGGPLSLWFRTTSDGGFWENWLSYLAVVPVDAVPIRRTTPRDDLRRTFPRSRAVQSSNRTGGGYL